MLVFQIHGTPHDVGFAFWGVLALVWAGWLGLRYLNWNFTHFVVTTNRVIFRTGVLAKHGVEIPMDRISNINFHQTIWERVIGAGDLEIESAGRDGQTKFNDVWHPDAVQQALYQEMEDHARTRASWAGGGGAQPAAPRRADAGCARTARPARRPARPRCHHGRGVRGQEGATARPHVSFDVHVVTLR